jgi:hypothetical protein
MSWPAPQPTSAPPPFEERISRIALTSVGLGVAPYLFWFEPIDLPDDWSTILGLIGVAMGPAAVVCGAVGITRTSSPLVRGRWLAVTGIVLGAAPIVLLLVAGFLLSRAPANHLAP